MPKLPRNIDAITLIVALRVLGYNVVRQTGSHIRLTSELMGYKHSITIPNHKPIKTGTLNSILNDIALYLNTDKSYLLDKLEL